MEIRFHLDEQLSPAIATALQREGIDVSTSQDLDLLGESDQSQLQFAVSQQRTLVTCDFDFLRPEMVQQAAFGICYCHPTKYAIGDFINALVLVHQCIGADELRHRVEYL